MQPIIKFEVSGQMFSINTDSNLPGTYIFRLVLGFYDSKLHRSAPPAEASV